MKLKSILTTIVLSGIVCFIALCIYNKMYHTKTAYLEIKKVFNGFQMKKELEKEYEKTQKGRDKILDSLSLNLKLMSKHLNDQKNAKVEIPKDEIYQFEYNREEFLKLKKQYQEDNAVLSQKYDNQILAQLTQYVIEYGKKNDYDIILGADGNGSLMYSKETYNISDDIIVYINNKYKGID
ncbi:MAG: OmpH family outer membrane protein [Bacteroidetes bacterium]|nr:OmpH family outer membrane protein [Bacteroidota bacterium]